MNLGFSENWKDKTPTYFIEKIWSGFKNISTHTEQILKDRFTYYTEYEAKFSKGWDIGNKGYAPKIHTIREDSSNRWKVGNKIHFIINNRSKNRFQFAPVLEVIGVQEIEINSRFGHSSMEVIIDGKIFGQYHYNYDEPVNYEGLLQFAKNDGFDTVDSFKKYFVPDNQDVFKGKIIHWTDKKY